MKRGYQETHNFSSEETLTSVVECDFDGFDTVPVEPLVNRIAFLANFIGFEVDNSNIVKLVEKHSQKLTELHYVSHRGVVEKSLSEEEVEI